MLISKLARLDPSLALSQQEYDVLFDMFDGLRIKDQVSSQLIYMVNSSSTCRLRLANVNEISKFQTRIRGPAEYFILTCGPITYKLIISLSVRPIMVVKV